MRAKRVYVLIFLEIVVFFGLVMVSAPFVDSLHLSDVVAQVLGIVFVSLFFFVVFKTFGCSWALSGINGAATFVYLLWLEITKTLTSFAVWYEESRFALIVIGALLIYAFREYTIGFLHISQRRK